MTQDHHPIPKSYGQHRRKAGDMAIRCVEFLWLREHTGVPTTPIDNLGRRPHTARHAANPVRQRVYL